MIVVIADDLSGAAELADAAVQAGLSAEVQNGFNARIGADVDVVCVNIGTRALSAAAAARAVARVARVVARTNPELVYKKCDSVLRGHVAEEAQAIARALGKSGVLLIPANPSRQRIIRGGIYYVRGVPLARTAFARDPDYPRRTSNVRRLLGRGAGSIETPDVVSAQGIHRHAARLDDDTLPAGGVDFFRVLLAARFPEKRGPRVRRSPQTLSQTSSLFVCGSLSAWESGRASECARHGIAVVPMPPGLWKPKYDKRLLGRWRDETVRSLRGNGAVMLAIGALKIAGAAESVVLLDRLAQAVKLLMKATRPGRVLLEGGATAEAVMAKMNLRRFTVESSPGPGVGALRPQGQRGPLFLIKPGSYPWPEAIWITR